MNGRWLAFLRQIDHVSKENQASKGTMVSRRNLLRALPIAFGIAGLDRLLAGRAAPLAADGSTSNSFPIQYSDAEWRRRLTPIQYNILRGHGTEPPGSSSLDKQYAAGTYLCAGCDTPMFSSQTKFNSGTGWPSFWAPLDGAIGTSVDRTLWMSRTEVHCARCGGHLGHVFDDGPPPTGLRYCINGAALKFVPA